MRAWKWGGGHLVASGANAHYNRCRAMVTAARNELYRWRVLKGPGLMPWCWAKDMDAVHRAHIWAARRVRSRGVGCS